MSRVPLLLAIPFASILGGCLADGPSTDDSGDDLATAAEELVGTCPVSGTDIHRSLVVTDPEVLSRFSFARVFNKIRSTAGVGANQSSVALFKAWMRTFDVGGVGRCDDPRVDPEGYGLVCPRVPEAKLAQVNPFPATAQVKFLPVGLFDRFDLAPSDGTNCGEYRIVYAMQSTDPNIVGRGFVIFEGALPNPHPTSGIDGCLPIAQFWQDLSNDTDVISRADKLERFYFKGGAIPGVPSLVRASAYGLAVGTSAAPGPGQIRTNFFVDFAEWHLREFKLRKTCTSATDATTCQLAFEHETVKTNPAEELFAGTHPRSAAFATTFVNQVPKLASTNVNQIGMTTREVHDEFESVSQRNDVRYDLVATAGLEQKIQAKLTAIGSTLTPVQILRRATTQTCAGCHQVSNGAALGGGKTWPSSLGFVQIDESSNLSQALTGTFLPRRRNVLESFINARCGAPPPPQAALSGDATETLGGSPVGAAN